MYNTKINEGYYSIISLFIKAEKCFANTTEIISDKKQEDRTYKITKKT